MEISLSRVMKVLALSLDLAEMSTITEQQIIETSTDIDYSKHEFLHHSKRTAYIAVSIGKTLNLDEATLEQLYVASLLHDIGVVKGIEYIHYSDIFIREHCIKGAEITENFPFYSSLSEIILYHHEDWDGNGLIGKSGDSIPIESQIIRMADLMELLYDERKPVHEQRDFIKNWIISRSGTNFSPDMVKAFIKLSKKDFFWFDIMNPQHLYFILDGILPNFNKTISLQEVEDIAYIFSDLIDNKSSFTAKHSHSIANLVYRVAIHLGYSKEKCTKMKIAGLLHDIGKMAIPNSILDKNGALTKDEFSIIKTHVYYTRLLLDQIGGIEDISQWASNHHEKLTGTGYPRGLNAEELSEESRIMGVCDIYQALTENRPYRSGMNNEAAFKILEEMAKNGYVCERALSYLKEVVYKMEQNNSRDAV